MECLARGMKGLNNIFSQIMQEKRVSIENLCAEPKFLNRFYSPLERERWITSVLAGSALQETVRGMKEYTRSYRERDVEPAVRIELFCLF